MPSRHEIFRKELSDTGSPLVNHSTNQYIAKRVVDGQRRFEIETVGSRREQRSLRKQQEFLSNLTKQQFNRALGNLREGHGSNEDALYVAEQYALGGNLDSAHVIMRLVDPETLPVERYPSPSNWDMDRLDPVLELPLSVPVDINKSA